MLSSVVKIETNWEGLKLEEAETANVGSSKIGLEDDRRDSIKEMLPE